nr:NS7a protein [Hipposideros bat coronavirus]
MHFYIFCTFYIIQCFLLLLSPVFEYYNPESPFYLRGFSYLSFAYFLLGFILAIFSLVSDLVWQVIDRFSLKCVLICRFLV